PQPDASPPAPPARTAEDSEAHPAESEHDLAAAEVLLRVYEQRRIAGQLAFYKSRIREFDANANLMVILGAVIMAVSSVISTYGAAANSAEIALVTALLPAIAALVASFRSLYQWEKQASLYRDASLGLREALLILPDDDLFKKNEAKTTLIELVDATETVFEAEINQWGQIAMGLERDKKHDTTNEKLLDLSENDVVGLNDRLLDPTRERATFDDGGVG
ncbi:MAG: SLATT domain-containing protein, partial [Anaerolineales bacterium]